VAVGSDPTKQVIQGLLVTPTGVIDGELVMEGDAITCVAVTCPVPAGASVFTVTDAFVYPGFIDAHNHVAYNVLPKWTPPRLYQNRSQWQAATPYKLFKEPYNTLKVKLFCEMVKWGEIAALMSGITTVQGTAPNQTCFKGFVRNIENQSDLGLPLDHIRTHILDVSSFKGKLDPDKTKAFVIHLAEGVDERSRREFDTLKAKKLLVPETAIIHGTAFGEAEFADMGRVGAKLIWSPQSNLALYGRTTNIPLALKHGVRVALGIDWNVSGSDTIFDELRVAAAVNEEQWNGAIPDSQWVEMITHSAAHALGVDHLLGSLQAGRKADIAIIRARTPDHSAGLLLNTAGDVEGVWVGGDLLYGNASVVEAARPNACELTVVQGTGKRVCAPMQALAAVLGKQFPYLVPTAR